MENTIVVKKNHLPTTTNMKQLWFLINVCHNLRSHKCSRSQISILSVKTTSWKLPQVILDINTDNYEDRRPMRTLVLTVRQSHQEKVELTSHQFLPFLPSLSQSWLLLWPPVNVGSVVVVLLYFWSWQDAVK